MKTWLLVVALIVTGDACAQAPEEPEVHASESAPPFQIRVETNLVTVRVVVRDAKGRVVGNLRKEDFRLFDNGRPQEIAGFSIETTAKRPSDADPAQPAAGTAPAHAAPVAQRFVALYFDDLHLDYGAVGHTRDAAWHYISTALRPEDRVAIFTSSNRGGIDFTDDRAKLHDVLFRVGPHSFTDPLSHECPAIGEYQAFLIQERQDQDTLDLAAAEGYACHCGRQEGCPYDARREATVKAAAIWDRAQIQSLDALEIADGVVRRLAAMPGQRILVLVSTGFLAATQEREVGVLIDRALRQNVVINALDAAGLYAKTSRNTHLEDRPDLEVRIIGLENEGLNVQRDVMAGLAAGTGGTFFHNSNDFDSGFRVTAQAPEVSYVLSFSLSDMKMDGKFHALKVAVASGSGWEIQARRGYFAPAKAPAKSELETLMFSQDARQELAATVTAQAAAPVMTVKIHVDLAALQFRREAGRNLNRLIFDTALFDRDGKYVAAKESSLDLRLPDTRLAELRKSGINAETSFQVQPGAYRIREVVRDSETKKVAALNCEVQVNAPPPVQTAVLPAAPARPTKHKEEKKIKSILDWTVPQFERGMPELKGLEPAQSQDGLPALLARTSQNVKAFFDELPETSAHERIELELLGWAEHKKEEFNYLAMPRPGTGGVSLEEYRTNAAGKRVQPQPLEHGFVTEGFVSMVVHFHPSYLAESRFRLLGKQNMYGHPTDVVAFAQIPGKARVRQSLKTEIRLVSILIQGIAWIDSNDGHIVRMRTEKLDPYFDPDLVGERTESRFTEVHFNDVRRAFWLPEEVVVTVNWDGVMFRNRHYYSDFLLFRVDTEQARH